jgi:hypothetical protein
MVHPYASYGPPVKSITVSLDDRPITFIRREAWMAHLLIERGEQGVTTLDTPGARLSQYVMKIRRQGVVIETIPVKHSGPYAGTHDRYVLRSPLSIVKVVRTGETAQ